MADIRLAKPVAGTTQTVPSAPDGRFIFDFPADAATLTRNGDDLVLTFEDGAAIQLQGFYTTYSKEEMPSFQVDGVEISGQDFFAALDEDLMPAAGPASGSSAARGGRYNEYGGSDLLDGLDHLGRLDIGFDGGTQLATDTVEPSPYSEVDHGVTVTPSGVGAATEVVTVYEAGLAGGSQAGEKDAPTMAGGSLSINAPDGVASIVIGGVVVFENGALTGKVVSTDEGTLSVTGYDSATGKLDFSYSLDRNTTEHVKSDPDTDTQISHTLVVTVTDTDGDSGSTAITVNVVDDMPEARADSISFTEAEAQKGASGESVLENDVFGADAPADKMVTSIEGGTLGQPVQGDYGTLTLNEDGTYTYKLGDKVDVPNGETYTEQFTYTIKDADGDTSTATLTITIEGDKIVPENPGSATIVVDEALLPDGNMVNSDNFDHVSSGTGSFIVNLNGEDGTVTLNYGTGEDTSTITLSLINGDTFDENWLSTNKTLTVNGVTVEVTGATQQDDGSWKIEYRYNLTGQQTHTGTGAIGAGDPLSDSINITVTDATGDTSTGSLTVTVHDDGPVLTDKIDFTVPEGKENYYDNSPEIMFTIGATPGNTKLKGLKFGADVGGEDAPAMLTVKVNGMEFSIEVTRDEDGQLHFSGDNGDTITFTGPEDTGKYGSLSYDKETGIFTYTRPTADIGGTTNSYDVSLTITDADGDSATVSEIYITVFRNPTVTDSTVTTDEGNIIMNDIPIGSGDENDKTSQVKNTAQGSITVNLDHADGTITIGDMPITVDKDGNILSVNGNTGGILGGQTIKGTYGYLSNISLVADDGTITINYTYTLNAPVNGGTTNVSGRGDSRLADQFTVTVTTQGGTETGTITANALDDAPVLAVSNPESVKDTADTIEIPLEKFSVGADVISLDEKTASISVEVGENEYTFTIIHESNGTYSFIAPNNQDDNLKIESTAEGGYKIVYTRAPQDIADGKDDSYTFDITVTDADGDTATGSVTVYAKVVPPTIDESGSTTDLLVDEDGLVHEPNSKTGAGQLVVDMHGQAGTVTIGGVQVTVDADGMVHLPDDEVADGIYGNLTITEASTTDGKTTIKYSYTLEKPYTDYVDDGNTTNTVENGDTFTVQVNGKDVASISVDIIDDVPTLTVETSSVEDQELPEDNLGSGKDVDFVFEETAANTENAGNEVQENILSQNNKDWENVTIYAAHVNYEKLNDDGYAIDDDGIQYKDNYHLEYSLYPNKGKNPADFGLMVRNEGMDFPQSQDGANGFETNAFVDANGNLTGSEAIVIDLGDKTAYGVSLDFGAFYSNFKGNEGQEHVLITFYKDDEPIGSRVIDAIQNEGGQAVVVHSDQFLSAGFDKVVISALQNTGGTGQASTFTLQGVGLITAPEPIRQVTGEITVASGADGYHAETGEDGTTTSNDFTQAHVRFDMPETLTIETEDGPVPVRLEVKTDSAGNSLLTGSNNGTEYFSVMLEQQRDGSWSWKMEQYQEFLVQGKDGQLGDLELGFITMDGDDDTATETVNIPLKNLPDLAVSQTTLVTDESYIDGLGSNTGPAEVGDGQANSAKASGTMSVNTYGKEGKLILTIDGEVSVFQLDADGKLSGTSEALVTTTYGTLTLTNGEAGKITYIYTQTQPYSHTPGEGPDQSREAESFTVQVKADGEMSDPATITVSIEDDAPVVTVEEGVSAQLEVTETGTAFIVDSTKFSSAEAFNTVYIVPWGTKSDFLLNGVEVGYSPVTVLKSEGQVEAVSADGIKGYSFGYDQNDVVTVNEKKLTVSVEGDGKTIHFLSSSGDDDTYTKVIVGEATITEAGKWTLNWFDQATNPQQDTDFTLPIIATDGDGDTAEIKVKVVPSEDEVGDSQAADALPEEEEKQPAAEKREGKDGSQGMMDGALLQSSMAAEAAAPRMAAATLLGMALVADAADDVLAAATGTDGMPHADVKADGLSSDIGDAPSTLHMDGAAQSGADAFDATLDSSLFAPGVMDPLADGTESLEGLLPDKEHAPFDAEGLLFTAAAPDLSDDASGLVGKGVASGDVLPPAGEEGILGTEETDVLTGTDDDDILLGGDGDEQIFGGSGDDYIDGGEGRDTIYAGDGNDIIVYDKADYLVSGGSGIDFMVSADSTLTMDTLLSGGKDGHEGPIVDSIEVLITGKDALSLTSIQELADKYGIELGTNPDGQETLTLDMGKWTEQADGSYDFHGGAEEGGLTLETNLQHDSTTSSDNGEMAQQVFILEHTNS